MADVIDDTIEDIKAWLVSVWDKIASFFTDKIAAIIDKTLSLVSSIANAISKSFNKIVTYISNLVNDIISSISSLVGDALSFLNSIYDRVAASITDLFDTVVSYISDTFNAVYEEMLLIADTVKATVVDLYDEVVNSIKTFVNDVVIWLDTLLDEVKLKITTLLDRAVSVVNAISQAIQDFISSVVDVVGASLRELMETASKLPAAVSELGDSFKSAIEEFIGKPLDDLPASMWTSLTDTFNELHGEQQDKVIEALHESYLSGNSPPKNNEELRSTFNALIPESGILRGIFLTFFGVLSATLSIASITSANAQIMLQEYSLTSPYAILNPADAIRANHFGITGDEDTKIILRKHGHSVNDASKLLKIGHQAPPEGEALSWYLRGIYSEGELDQALNKNGWDDVDKAALKQAAQIIPPVQDLITMAVREVFTPEIAERFGQFEEFPKDFEKWAAKLGLSEDWSKNYWASHWVLPSPQMGFEMLHRRVISQDDLNMLLKSADVMPFWRDKIVDISYAPFTRVDIRRMHKTGVLNEQEVFESYQDIGYNEDKARRLTDFTLKLNKEKDVDDDIELLALTRTNIINFYADGLLDKAEATSMLRGLGLSAEATDLYLTSIDLDEQRTERKDETSLILDKANAGLITFEQAQDALAELGLETREMGKAFTRLTRQQTQRTKLPSKSNLDKMLEANIIEEAEYIETLHLLGYSELWAERLLQLIRGK
jgi:hypothetical protein